jgi:membrane protease YdiL (CAAX protease family)
MRSQSFLRRYPEVPFVVLAYILGVPILLLRFVDLPFEPVLVYASWTPNLAAFLVLGLLLREREGIRRLVMGWAKWRVGVRWYLVSFSPILVALLAGVVFIALGGTPTAPESPIGLPLLTFFVLSIVTGAAGEELGWRGFLLPRLQRRFNALVSSLIVGVVWAIWHLPLWFLPGCGWDATPYWAFALSAVSSSVLITFVFNNTGASLLMASIIHFSLNFGMGVVRMFGLLPSPREAWVIVSVLYTLYAGTITVLSAAGSPRAKGASRALARGRAGPP